MHRLWVVAAWGLFWASGCAGCGRVDDPATDAGNTITTSSSSSRAGVTSLAGGSSGMANATSTARPSSGTSTTATSSTVGSTSTTSTGATSTGATSTTAASSAATSLVAPSSSSAGTSSSSASGPPPPRPATLAEYWAGTAEWKLQHIYTNVETGWPYGFDAGSHITVVGHDWYLFGRKLQASAAAGCGLTPALTTYVRKSTDKGLTWSAAVDLFNNDPGTPWECAATDGDAWYDAGTNTWHYLFQCLGVGTAWNGCHATRVGDPMGLFTPDTNNPTLPAGTLWHSICDQGGDDCSTLAGGVRHVADEGTFNIFTRAPDGNWFVAFHGFDGHNGYRGIAKTADFTHWVAGDPAQGVPADAIHDLRDSLAWREEWNAGGPIGNGAGSILEENGVYYSISEVGDISLACVPGQRWDWGMYRSASLTSTAWEQLPAGNPFLYSSDLAEPTVSLPCNPAYGRLFRDVETGSIFLTISHSTYEPTRAGLYLYQLVSSGNVLRNADLWMCHAGPWTIFPGSTTNLAVYRFPNTSTDGNCYLATNCGAASCAAGQSIYQDVAFSVAVTTQVAFGGRFSTDSGNGVADLALFALDSAGAPLAQQSVRVNATPAWQAFSGVLQVPVGTVTLRYQVYLSSSETFRMDEAYAIAF